MNRIKLMLSILLMLAASVGLAAEAIVRLPSEGGASLPYLLSQGEADKPPAAVAVLFNGGGGVVGLNKRIPQPAPTFWSAHVRCLSARALRAPWSMCRLTSTP